MAITYVNIASTTLGSTQSVVTFSGIPSTYTDLVVRFSGRGTGGGDWGPLQITINNTAGTAYGWTNMQGAGGAGYSSTRGTSDSRWYQDNVINQDGANVANTFANGEIYFPNYTSSSSKIVQAYTVGEINNSFGYLGLLAGLSTTITSAINRIDLSCNFGWKTDSSFYLYGIKNS